MEDKEIGHLKEITDEYYQLIDSGFKKRAALRKMCKIHNSTKNDLLEIINGWIEKD